MKKIFILGLVLLPLLSASEKEWPSGSAMHTGIEVNKKRYTKNEIANNLVIKIDNILKKYSQYDEPGISKQHEYWLKYVDITCTKVGQMSGAGGSWPSTKALQCKENMLDQKLFKLTNSLRCLKRYVKNGTAGDEPSSRMYTCMYQSFSITY